MTNYIGYKILSWLNYIGFNLFILAGGKRMKRCLLFMCVFQCIVDLLGGQNDMVVYDIIESRYCLHIAFKYFL